MTHKEVKKYILDNFNQADLIPIEWTNLLSHCLLDLFKYDVDVLLEKSEHLSCFHDDDSCDGVFEDDVPNHLFLRVATGSNPKHWFRAFVHEYAHFCQWKSRRTHINGSLELEIDCEKRAIKIMRKFDVSRTYINSVIRVANIYLFWTAYCENNSDPVDLPVPNSVRKQIKTTFYEDYRDVPQPLLNIFNGQKTILPNYCQQTKTPI